MTDTTPYRCSDCNEVVTLERRHWDDHLIAACDCEAVNVRVGRKTPEEWRSNE